MLRELLLLRMAYTLLTTTRLLYGGDVGGGIGAGSSGPRVPPAAAVNSAILLAAHFMERASGQDGRFVYLIDIRSGQVSQSYSIVRHAGAIYALAMLNRAQGDKLAVDARGTTQRCGEPYRSSRDRDPMNDSRA
jgi:hypothetical protein